MTIEASFESCRRFDIDNAALSLWSFKKKIGENLDFTAKSVLVTASLTAELKRIAIALRERCAEVEEYSLLTQNNESGLLAIGSIQTAFPRLKELVDRPVEECLITDKKQIENSAGYLIRLQSNQEVIYFVKKAPDNWKAKKAINSLNVILNANQMDLVEDRAFTIARSFDFIAVGEHILVRDKAAFESLFNFKQMYVNAFAILQQDENFRGLFADMQPLIGHVGTNTMHLRRMEVIRRKGFYTNADYMERLRQANVRRGWNIQFDEDGRIVPTEATIRTILQVLLNHRLFSELTLGDFDVPYAVPVGH